MSDRAIGRRGGDGQTARDRTDHPTLAERELRYDALFEAMSEGFVLCQTDRDETGRLVDYTIIEANPVVRRMVGPDVRIAGAKLSDGAGDQTAWLAFCERVLKSGKPEGFEYHDAASDRWYEIRVTRVTDDLMAQLIFDITERKRAEVRQAELFDELNHRVKNNLMLVSGILQMKARATSHAAVRDQLLRAVARVQSIAQVHSALYRGSRKNDVDFADFVTALCASISQSLMHDERLDLQVEAEAVTLSVDSAIALGMLVNELVTNAVKYAYGPHDHGEIRVRFKREADGLVLSVSDDGRGLSKAAEDASDGLGMKLVKSLVKQVRGRLSVRRRPGTRFVIRFPAS